MMNREIKIFSLLLLVTVTLIALHILIGKELSLFDLDKERTVPAYWSGAQLMIVASLAWASSLLSHRRAEILAWRVLSLFFLALGFDEISELHENITYYLNKLIDPLDIFRSPTYMWLIFLSPVIIGVTVFLAWFVKRWTHEEKIVRRFFITGLGLFLFALGLELASGLIADRAILRLEVILEEASEMIGVSCFLVALIATASKRFNARYMPRQ